MRKMLVVVICLAASGALRGRAQEQQQQPPPPTPTFRTGVDVVAVDVSATDSRGRPVEDLRAPDFLVKIDGIERRVISADLVRIDVEAARRQAADPFEPLFTSNQTPPNGRMIVIAMDQLHVRPGAARPVLAAAGRFLDKLSPLDRVAFSAYPQPGPQIGFTDDRTRIKNAMETVVGGQRRYVSRFNIGLTEAYAVTQRDIRMLGIVVTRECRGMRGFALEDCEREIEIECQLMVSRVKDDTEASLRSLRELMVYMSLIEGPKTLILVSEGMVLPDATAINDIIHLASVGRITINLLLMDVSPADASIGVRPPTGREDRQLEVAGIEDLAAYTRGTRFNVLGNGDNIFDRIISEISAYYLLGVEQLPTDRDGKRHRIDVEVRRRDVTLHSRRAFVLSAASGSRRTPEENLTDALKSPFAVAELPLRGTTFVTQDSASDKVRLMLALEVGLAGAKPEEFTLGYALIDREGVVVGSAAEKKTLQPADARPNAPLEYHTNVMLDPGTYTLRVAAVDSTGRRGSVVHTVNAWQMAGEPFAFGDLFVGNIPESGQIIKPGVEPHVDAGAVAAFVELYSTASSSFANVEVTFEIAEDQDGPALVSAKGEQLPGSQPNWRMAQAAVDASSLQPGRYITRAKIARNGSPAGVLTRPLVLGETRASALVTSSVPIALGEIAKFDRSAVLAPGIVTGMLDVLSARGPQLKDSVTEARAGRYGAAALEALAAGDQTAASFLRGLDFYAKGQIDQAATQLSIAAGPRREFFPAGFFLGAAYAEVGRDRDAAGVWQMTIGSEPRPPAVYALFADARFRDGQPQSVIDVLAPVYERTPADDQVARRLAMAYTVVGRYADAQPVLDRYLSRNGTDQEALFAAILGSYEIHAREKSVVTVDERAKLTKYAAAYRGTQEPLVTKYLRALDVK